MNIYNDDCFNIFPKIKRKSIDLILVDLPYGQTNCKWDIPIDLDKMWIELKKICKKNCMYCFFTTTKYGVNLINSNPKWFRYDLVWEKSNAVGYLSANKMPLRKHEMIYVFNDDSNRCGLILNIELRTYFQNVKKFIGKTKNEINKELGNQSTDHCFRDSSQFELPTEKTYNQLIKKYDINKIDNFLEYKKLKSLWEKPRDGTYNPQKTKGKPYKTNGNKLKNKSVYGQTEVPPVENKTGDRHPTSVISHEMIYVFNDENNDDTENEYNIELRTYFKNVLKFIGKTRNEINKELGNQRAEHCFGFSNSQFGIPTEKTYNQLIKKYDINKIDNFLEYKKVKSLWEKPKILTYNPQKTKGKPYKTKEHKYKDKDVYGETGRPLVENKTGDRHPTTILKYKSETKTIHRTQKPIKLTEWLIKTYSNKNDLVMDFCMGSGTTIVACKNLERDYIGIEKDKEIYDLAIKRIN